MQRRSITAAAVTLAALLVCGTGLAQDRIFVSVFEPFPNGTVYEIDFNLGTATPIITGLANPEDIVCKEATDELFICESLFHQVLSLDLVGLTTTNIIPTAGFVPGPEGPSISPAGDLYVNTRRIMGTADGVWMVPGGNPANPAVQALPPFTTFGEGSVFGTAGASAGGLLAADRVNGRVILSNPPGSGPVLFVAGLVEPFGIAVDSAGVVYVAEGGAGRVSMWSPDGVPMGNLIAGLFRPSFLEVDSFDNVVIADGNRVLQVDPSGAVIGQINMANATGVAIYLDPPSAPCPHSQGFWKNHPGEWPASPLALGNETYTQAEALDLLRTPVSGDASLILVKQVIAAKLNIMTGSDRVPVNGYIVDADNLFATYPGKLPYDVHPSTTDGHTMTTLGGVLDEYNNQLLTPDCTERATLPMRATSEGGGCSGVIGAPMPPADILGTMLPLLALALGLLALRMLRGLRPAVARQKVLT